MAACGMSELPLIVIVGPTASGKTALAVKLAQEFSGEIICADSRTVYKGMDVGTAKPTQEERAVVPHWGLDLLEPGERFTAADFKRYADAKIREIRSRGHVPFLVGGTGLYVDAVVFDYQFGHPEDPERREVLAQMSLEQLQEYCVKNNIALPENNRNKRYVIRAIERKGISGKRREEPVTNAFIVGIATDREVLRRRIYQRAEHIFEQGVVEEAIRLGKKYGWESEAMTGNIYPLIRTYRAGEITLLELKERFAVRDWQLAKRQLTWLRRNRFVVWLPLDEAQGYLTDILVNARNS